MRIEVRYLLIALLLAIVNTALAEDRLVFLPDLQPFELYHRRLLPELPSILSEDSHSLDSSFSWSNTYNAKNGGYLVDGEVREATLKYSYGLTEDWTLTGDLGARMVDSGVMDGVIRGWDQALGVSTRVRDRRGKNKYFAEVIRENGKSISIDREPFGLTDARIGARYRLQDDKVSKTKLSIGLDLTLPTHLETYGQDSFDYRLSFLGSQRLGSFLLFGSLSGALLGDERENGLEFRTGTWDGVVGLLLFISDNWSFQFDQIVESTTVTNITHYPNLVYYLDVAARYQFNPALSGHIGVRENVFYSKASTDVTGIIGLSYAWSNR